MASGQAVLCCIPSLLSSDVQTPGAMRAHLPLLIPGHTQLRATGSIASGCQAQRRRQRHRPSERRRRWPPRPQRDAHLLRCAAGGVRPAEACR
jgi:hypothetical protein